MSVNSTLIALIVIIVLFELSVVVYGIIRHMVNRIVSPSNEGNGNLA